MEKFLLKIIRFGTYLILLTPLIVSNKFFFPFVSPKTLFFFGLAEIIFFAYLILALINSKYRPRLNPLFFSFAVFLIIFILSSLFGVDFLNSFWSKYERMTGGLMWIHLFAFFAVLASVFRKKEEWIKILSFSVFIALIISFLAILEKIGVNLLGQNSRGGATLGNSSFLGAYLLFNFFFALYLFFETNCKKFYVCFYKSFNFFALLGVGIIGLTLYFSTARAALLSTVGGIAIIVVLWLVFHKKRKLKYLGSVILAVGVIAGIILTSLLFISPDLIEEKMIEKFGSSTIKPRWEIYDMAWKGFAERPLLGWGPENFAPVFTKFFNPQFFSGGFGSDVWYDKAHNVIFDSLVSVGILGFLAYFSIFAVGLGVLWRKFKKKKIIFWEAAVFSALLIAYCVQNLTVFDMVGTCLMFSLVLGFIGRADEDSVDSEATGQKFRKNNLKKKTLPIFLVVALFVFSFSIFFVNPLKTARYVIVAISQPPFSQERLLLYKKSLKTSPLGRDQILEFFGDSAERYSQYEQINTVPKERIISEFEFVSQEMEKSIKRSPLNFRMFFKLGSFYNAYARFDKSKLADAERVLKEAIELSPGNQQGYWFLAQTKLLQGDANEAIALAEKAVGIGPNILKSHLILLQFVLVRGDQALLGEKVGDALKINPDWAPYIRDVLEAKKE